MKKVDTVVCISEDELNFDFIKGEIETLLEKTEFKTGDTSIIKFENKFGKCIFLTITFIDNEKNLITIDLAVADVMNVEDLLKTKRQYRETIYLSDVTATKDEINLFVGFFTDAFINIANGLKGLENLKACLKCHQ